VSGYPVVEDECLLRRLKMKTSLGRGEYDGSSHTRHATAAASLSQRNSHVFLATFTAVDPGIAPLLTTPLYKPVRGDAEDHSKA